MFGRLSHAAKSLTVGLTLVLAATACGDDEETTQSGSEPSDQAELSGTIRVDGSSTVAPLSETAAEMFQSECGDDNLVPEAKCQGDASPPSTQGPKCPVDRRRCDRPVRGEDREHGSNHLAPVMAIRSPTCGRPR